jgi:hypothetical protein
MKSREVSELGAGEVRTTVARFSPGRGRRRRSGRGWVSDGKAADALRHTEINAQLTTICRIYQRNNVFK